MTEQLKIPEFTVNFLEAMQHVGYSKSIYKSYSPIVASLTEYAAEQGQEYYTVDFAHQFIDAVYPVRTELRPFQWSNKEKAARRAVKLMDDFALSGALLSHTSPTAGLGEHSIELTDKYAHWLKSRGYASTTIRGQTCIVLGFMRFLAQIQCEAENITDKEVVRYLNTREDYSNSSRSAALYSLKNFAQFLFDKNIIAKDIVQLFPQGHKYRLANIVSVWKPGNVEKILGAVDRGSPIGRRDYAIILIAARLGLRQSDIFGLRIDSVDWRNSRIETTQSKTAQPISLPLPEDVGWAIIDYLKHGRPQVDSLYIFVCHSKSAWGKQMTGTFDVMLGKYIRQARLSLSEGQKHGMHTLRHTLASRLLEAKTPLPVISEILGQLSPDAVEKYLKVDVEMLRQCALNPQEVFEDANCV